MINLDGHSATIAGLKLRTTLPGKMFFVTSDDFLNFKNNVLNKSTQWYVQNQAKEYITIPGTWTSAAGGKNIVSLVRQENLKRVVVLNDVSKTTKTRLYHHTFHQAISCSTICCQYCSTAL